MDSKTQDQWEQDRERQRDEARIEAIAEEAKQAASWQMPDDPAERNAMIASGTCPVCGGAWGDDPAGHGPECINGQASQVGPGRRWRQGRGRQRNGDRSRRAHPLDAKARTTRARA